MSSSLLEPPASLPPSAILKLSQEAPRILSKSTKSSLPYPLSLLFTSESPDLWKTHENLLICCLITGDDKSARQCLDRLRERFGPQNERVMALSGMYKEAIASTPQEIEAVMRGYDQSIEEDPTNVPIRKRKVALLRSTGKAPEAISALVELLDAFPTDMEAWAELSDLYLAQTLFTQAIYCQEEVLLASPNAWNAHARLGELLYLSVQTNASSSDNATLKAMSEALRRFCRSIELCEDYLRGYYGLMMTSKRLIELLPSNSGSSKTSVVPSDPASGDVPLPSLESVQKLRELATKKLAEIVRRSAAKEKGYEGYDEAEVIAARELLDREAQKVER